MNHILETVAVAVLGLVCATAVLAAEAPETNATQVSNGLKVTLASAKEKYASTEAVQLTSTFENVGQAEMSLTFWWNCRLKIVDAQGNIVQPAKGRELPCGRGETPTSLAPGKTKSRAQPLGCTQPQGAPQSVGWSYKLKPGTYKIALLFEAPPTHGYDVDKSEKAWKGKVVSNEVTITIAE